MHITKCRRLKHASTHCWYATLLWQAHILAKYVHRPSPFSNIYAQHHCLRWSSESDCHRHNRHCGSHHSTAFCPHLCVITAVAQIAGQWEKRIIMTAATSLFSDYGKKKKLEIQLCKLFMQRVKQQWTHMFQLYGPASHGGTRLKYTITTATRCLDLLIGAPTAPAHLIATAAGHVIASCVKVLMWKSSTDSS